MRPSRLSKALIWLAMSFVARSCDATTRVDIDSVGAGLEVTVAIEDNGMPCDAIGLAPGRPSDLRWTRCAGPRDGHAATAVHARQLSCDRKDGHGTLRGMPKLRNACHCHHPACVVAVAACQAWRIASRGTILVAGTNRPMTGDGG